MSSKKTRNLTPVLAALLLPLFTLGCATKKYVRNTVAPLEMRVNTVQQKTQENAGNIRDLDRKTEQGISQAQDKADQATQQAGQAEQDAQNAGQKAQKGIDQALQVKEDLAKADQFQPLTTQSVLFGFNRSTLTDDDKQTLDQLAQKIKSLQHYVIQIQGFTDTTGPKTYNLALSQRRANAVVRYLTMEHQIPLVRIYKLGYGEESPVASNRTLKGRKENRRVDVTVMVPETAMARSEQTSSSQSMAQQ